MITDRIFFAVGAGPTVLRWPGWLHLHSLLIKRNASTLEYVDFLVQFVRYKPTYKDVIRAITTIIGDTSIYETFRCDLIRISRAGPGDEVNLRLLRDYLIKSKKTVTTIVKSLC
jgi:hypothetical protein